MQSVNLRHMRSLQLSPNFWQTAVHLWHSVPLHLQHQPSMPRRNGGSNVNVHRSAAVNSLMLRRFSLKPKQAHMSPESVLRRQISVLGGKLAPFAARVRGPITATVFVRAWLQFRSVSWSEEIIRRPSCLFSVLWQAIGV